MRPTLRETCACGATTEAVDWGTTDLHFAHFRKTHRHIEPQPLAPVMRARGPVIVVRGRMPRRLRQRAA